MIPGKITISRPSYDDGRDKIAISISDVDAKVELVELQIDLDQFTRALTGQSRIPCEIEPKNLDVIGKICEVKPFEFPLGEGSTYRDKEVAIELLPVVQPKGWVADEYFGSQSSFFSKQLLEGGVIQKWARTTLRRWVDRNES